jgi:hypothetical protein
MSQPPEPRPAPLSRASLSLGIASAAFVFGLGITALIGANQGWLGLVGIPLLIFGAAAAFLGFLSILLGLASLVVEPSSRSSAVMALSMGMLGICLYLLVTNALTS